VKKLDEALDDLRYLRRLADGARPRAAPASIALLWAGVSLIGFPLVDFAPHAAERFWLAASPAAMILTAWLAVRHARRAGQIDGARGLVQLQHWGGMLVAVFLCSAAGLLGAIDERATPKMVLVVLALGFWTAGVHLDRGLRWVAALIAAGYALVLLKWLAFPWTVVGLAVAAGLMIMARGGSRAHAEEG
jgi:hypothetical protein